MRRVLERLPKARYHIVQVLGDYYYKDTPIDEAIKYVFKRLPADKRVNSDEDINRLIE
jgi:hypothetical protein